MSTPLYRVLRIPVKVTSTPSVIAYAPKRRPTDARESSGRTSAANPNRTARSPRSASAHQFFESAASIDGVRGLRTYAPFYLAPRT